jgi:hypothetical protein
MQDQRAGREPRSVLVPKPGGDAALPQPLLARSAAHPDPAEVEVLNRGMGEYRG